VEVFRDGQQSETGFFCAYVTTAR